MAKRKKSAHYKSSDMFGENHVVIMEKRETPKKRGGAAKGDEVVILTYKRRNQMVRTKGLIETIPADDLKKRIEGMKEV